MRLGSIVLAWGLLASACSGEPEDDADPEPVVGMLVDALATDTDYLYYMTFEAIWRVPLEGGSHETVVAFGSPTGDRYTALYAGVDDVVFETITPLDRGERRTLHRVSKEGGSPTTLATSTDPHAFRGIALDGDRVYYATDAGLFRVPLAGGPSELVSAGSETSAHPIVTPTLVGDDVFWAEGERLFKSAKTASSGPGIEVAAFEATAEIIGSDERLVVALSPEQPEDAVTFVEVDPATGLPVRAPIELGRELWGSLATSDAVWAGSRDGLLRVPRAGGAAEQLTTESVAPLAASDDAVFAGTISGVVRFER